MSDGDIDWYGPETATFGDRLAAAREAAGMTQSQLARRLGIKKATLVAWEDDLSEPRANKLSMVAGMLNVSIVWLMTGTGEGAAPPAEEDAGPDLRAVLSELRTLREQMRDCSDRAARLEKRLRNLAPREDAAA